MPGKPATQEQRLLAARLIAGGTAHTATASSIGISVRTLQRWLADPAFTKMIEKALRATEHSEHRTAVRSARVHGVPEPPSAAQVRAARATMQRSPEDMIRADDTLSDEERERRLQLLQREERRRRAINPTDADIQQWVLEAAPRESELDVYDYNDARRGRISDRARRRYAAKDYPRTTPQFQIIGIDTNASRMYEEMRPPSWAADAFAGQYDGRNDGGFFDGGGGRYALREIFVPADDAA